MFVEDFAATPTIANPVGYVGEVAAVTRKNRLRSPSVEHLASLLRSHLTSDFASFAASYVDKGRDKDDGEAAEDVDQAALYIVAKVLFGRVGSPRADFKKCSIRFRVVEIKSGIGIVIDDDGFGLATDDAIWFPPLVAPVGRQVAL